MRRWLPQVRELVLVLARTQSGQQRGLLRLLQRVWRQPTRIRQTYQIWHHHSIQQPVYPRAYRLESL